MKQFYRSKRALYLAVLFLLLTPILSVCKLSAQQRKDGKQVVPHGFEKVDSIRFGMLRPYDVGMWQNPKYYVVDTLIDTLGVNAVENFEADVTGNKMLYGHEKTICAGGFLDSAIGPNLFSFAHDLNQAATA